MTGWGDVNVAPLPTALTWEGDTEPAEHWPEL